MKFLIKLYNAFRCKVCGYPYYQCVCNHDEMDDE